jgi:hypothetical protein
MIDLGFFIPFFVGYVLYIFSIIMILNGNIYIKIIFTSIVIYMLYVTFNYGLPDSHIDKKSFKEKFIYFLENFYISIPLTYIYIPMYLYQKYYLKMF